MPAAEVGPERIRHVDLRVRDLPEQVVADAPLSARTNQQIGIGLTGGVEKAREALLVQILWAHAGFDRSTSGVDDLGAAAVVQRDVEEHAATGGRALDRDVELFLDVGRQLLHASNHTET